jgi:hypothetical protein
MYIYIHMYWNIGIFRYLCVFILFCMHVDLNIGKCPMHTHIYHIYIYLSIYMVVDQNSVLGERPFFANKHVTFANSMFFSRGTHVGQQCLSYEDSFITWLSRIASWSPCEHAASITESLFRARWLLIKLFFGMNFGRSFAELSRKFRESIYYPQTPAISRGRIRGKASTRGLGVWLWQSLTFRSLAAAFLICYSFLRLQKTMWESASKDVLQAVAKPHLWKLACYLWREWQPFTSCICIQYDS